MISKQALRVAARARQAQLAAQMPDYSDFIAAFAGELPMPDGVIVAGYWPIRAEADPRGLMRAFAAAGHCVALPRIEGRDLPLEFRLWQDGDTLVPNAFGVPEPLGTAPAVVPGAVLIPLLAFDAEGFRLGHGGGYYDRTLARLRPGGLAIGIAYAGQEIATLPHEAHDQRLDLVLTERGITFFES